MFSEIIVQPGANMFIWGFVIIVGIIKAISVADFISSKSCDCDDDE